MYSVILANEIFNKDFSAKDFFEDNDKEVSAEDILKEFSPDDIAKIEQVEAKLEDVIETIKLFKSGEVYSPERVILHGRIADILLSDNVIERATPTEQSHIFILLGGRGGSGKSWFKGRVYDPSEFVVLDADEIKEMLPEYQEWNAFQVHEESGEIFDAITDFALSLGLNIVHDSTLKTEKKAIELIQKFKEEGYRIEVHYMYLPRDKAAKRALKRFLNNGRYVPIEVILGNITNELCFDSVKQLVDVWSFRSNDVSEGEEPILLAQYSNI